MRYCLLIICAGLMTACTKVDENARLRHALDDVISAVEERSVTKVSQYLSPDFKIARHNRTRDIQGLMVFHFRSNSVINVFTTDLQLNIENSEGHIRFNALVTGSSHWFPQRGQRYFVKTRWDKTTGDWKLNRLDWEKHK